MQDDTTRAMMLFGDRISAQSLGQRGDFLSLIYDIATYDEVLYLAR